MRLTRFLPGVRDYDHARPGRDLTAGIMVGLVALPLALGFGVSSGMGAQAGLVTAIVAGAIAAVFGGSHVQVSGPTGAMHVVRAAYRVRVERRRLVVERARGSSSSSPGCLVCHLGSIRPRMFRTSRATSD